MSSLARERISRAVLAGCAVLIAAHAIVGVEPMTGVMLAVVGLVPVALVASSSRRSAVAVGLAIALLSGTTLVIATHRRIEAGAQATEIAGLLLGIIVALAVVPAALLGWAFAREAFDEPERPEDREAPG